VNEIGLAAAISGGFWRWNVRSKRVIAGRGVSDLHCRSTQKPTRMILAAKVMA